MRGDLVTIVTQGDFGKPRPALVIQSDLFNELSSITVLPVTSTLVDAPLLRVTVEPTPENGFGTSQDSCRLIHAITCLLFQLG